MKYQVASLSLEKLDIDSDQIQMLEPWFGPPWLGDRDQAILPLPLILPAPGRSLKKPNRSASWNMAT